VFSFPPDVVDKLTMEQVIFFQQMYSEIKRREEAELKKIRSR
jgi:hypothetical protein